MEETLLYKSLRVSVLIFSDIVLFIVTHILKVTLLNIKIIKIIKIYVRPMSQVLRSVNLALVNVFPKIFV